MSELDPKFPDQQPEVKPAGETGSQAEVDEIMKKYDRESNVRAWEGAPKMIIRFVMAAFMLLMIYMNMWAKWSGQIRCCVFLGCLVPFCFLIYPIKKGDVRVNHMPWYDIVLAIVGAVPFFYYVINFEKIVNMGMNIGTLEKIMAVIGVLVIFECCRRSVGIPILCVVGFFICYTLFISGKSMKFMLYNLFYANDMGMLSTPISVCSTFIVLFLLFGSFLEATGISNFFIDCANALVGWASGGPAKVAVVSSALCGMVSGSSVGNTVTTGSVTIPMMKRTGYPGEFAGAVEAAASTGGQIMPPIMGAAAFIMAEMTQTDYSKIIVRAILPACLYFTGIFLMVHFTAKKLGLKGLEKKTLPKWKKLLPKIYMLVPLVALVVMIVNGQTLAKSACIASLLCIVVSLINKENRMTPMGLVKALEGGAKNTISIAMACAVAGMIGGCITMTGLAAKLITGVVKLSNGHLIIALFLTMLCCIILGMGVPTTANYVIMASTCAPILINGMSVHVLAANLFVFYFGIVADITPPVALAAYAGAAIAKSNPMKTAFNATKLAIAAFIIPYIFVYNNVLIFVGEFSVIDAVLAVATCFLGMYGISIGLTGFFKAETPIWERILFLAGGFCMIVPGWTTDLIGLGLLAAAIVLNMLRAKKAAPTAAA